jgi:iron complex outermembrane receptor protein
MRRCFLVTALVGLTSAAPCFGQEAGADQTTAEAKEIPTLADSGQVLEEVIVTAGFWNRAQMSSPGSATVITGRDIEGMAAEHLETVLAMSPNVTYSSASSRARFVQIRGVGDLEQFVDPKHYPSVGISFDDINLGGAASAAMLFDTERVEILRGPQGTRFGASALAGLVNVRSRAPTRDFEGFVSAGLADYGTESLGAALGGPLSTAVSARLAVHQHRSNGYVDNAFLGRNDTNGFDESTLRANLRIEPGKRAAYDLTLLRFESDNGYDAFSLDNQRVTLSDQPGHDRQFSTALAAHGTWSLGEASSIEATATQLGSDLDYGFDEDWTFIGICDGTLCDPVFDLFSNTDTYFRDRSETTLDVRWLNEWERAGDRSHRIVVGFFGQERDENLHRQYYGDFLSAYATERRALYTQLSYALTPRIELTAGLRYEQFDDTYGDSFGSSSASSDELHSGELGLSIATAENSLVYLTIARGEKAGGVNTEASANRPFMQSLFQDFLASRLRVATETLISTEIGYKRSFYDGQINIRSAIFHMDRENAQLESWIWDGINLLWVGLLDNVEGSNRGAEFELSALLGRSWELTAALGLLDSEVDSIVTFDLDQDAFLVRRGIDQAKSPNWQASIAAQWSPNEQWSARFEIDSRDGSSYGYYHTGELSSSTVLHTSITRQMGQASLRFYARNLTNQDVEVHGLYFGNDPRKGWVNESYYQYGEPRLVGVSMNYAF